MINEIALKLLGSFPRSFINCHGEFIAHEKANEYFKLNICADEEEVKCKALEWLSRGAYKTELYRAKKKNEEFHVFMLNGINTFLGTSFTHEDMEIVYTYLGNNVNRKKCLEFIRSGYDMNLLKERSGQG